MSGPADPRIDQQVAKMRAVLAELAPGAELVPYPPGVAEWIEAGVTDDQIRAWVDAYARRWLAERQAEQQVLDGMEAGP